MVECGACESFRTFAERYYGPLLRQYGFGIVACAEGQGGRECILMYHSDHCRLLLSHSDGSDDCLLGDPEQPFPSSGLHGSRGEEGW
jgi:hypothetical protein